MGNPFVLKKIRNYIVGWIGAWLIRIIGVTLRFRIRDEAGLTSDAFSSEPIVFAFWHNRMFLMPYLYRTFLPKRKAACLVSASQDGEMIARVLASFGLEAVRGSSSRRGKEAFRELTEILKKGWDVAITPDGPRGPRYEAHIGVVGLAAISECSLIPISYSLPWKIKLRSWDRFMIPLPWSLCFVHVGKPLRIENSLKEDALEEARKELQQRLIEMTREAE